jgi:outer membrane protein
MAVAGFWWLVACGAALSGQSLNISKAVEGALKNYPAIRISQEQLTAASAGIQLARTSYLPRVDLLAQVNRATRNNVFGLLLPQNVIPSMSGPVIGSNNFGTAWGSAAGVLVSWEPFDFGLRRANIAVASATRSEAEATLQRTRYDIAVATADAYLTLAASEETVRAAQAGVDRADTVLRTIQALVNSGLRPGADASRAQAELAAARTQWIQAKESTEVARATISQFVGGEPGQITLAAPKLRELPPEQDSAIVNVSGNPIAAEQGAVLDRTKAELRALERTYFPRFSLQGSAYARGTGAETDGALLGGLNGLGPNVQNYAVGFTVTFPAMDLPALQARRAMQSANVRAETARSQQIAIDLKARWNAAAARLRGAREVAANTPVQVNAARSALQQSTARYQAGLANIDEVAETQRLLTQAEIDDSLARLSVWRGLLEIATVAGDLQPFLMEASQ